MDKLEAFWTDIDVLSIGKMVSREGKATVIKRYIGLVQDYCKNNEIHLTDSEIADYIEELVDSVSGDLFTISTEINDECDDFEEFADGTTDENELMELIVARAKSCFERALLGPLAYLAVKIALYQNRDFYDFERIVAQMVANGENEYGEYLDQYLSKVANEWNSKDSVAHGRSLVGWATNYREYKWLVAFFPEVAPKSKRKYISFKKNNTKEYVKLKELAKGKGYDLDDDAWKTDIYR